MSTYVLVHGAWHGGWCWKRVRSALTARGHEVFTPTLTGLADRSHLLSPDVDLETHITDVVNLFRWEDLTDVVLCGHSYGGAVVSGAADRVPGRIAALVYLDAFVLLDGQSLLDALPARSREAQVEAARAYGDGWRLPAASARGFNVKVDDRDWVDGKCTPQPLATFQQPLSLAGGIDKITNVTYIKAAGWSGPFEPFYDLAQARKWKTVTMNCGHEVMVDQPEELADELVAVLAPGA